MHGAFADASSFQPVTKGLLDSGIPVVAVAVPNRSLIGDAALVRAFVETIEGPVLLVGHSYGGAIITEAGNASNVAALLYLAGYALAEGESMAQLQGQFPDSDLPDALIQTPMPATKHSPAAVPGSTSAPRTEANFAGSTHTSTSAGECLVAGIGVWMSASGRSESGNWPWSCAMLSPSASAYPAR